MKFKTKRDAFFIRLWVIMMVSIQAVFLFPLLLEEIQLADFLIVLILDALITGFMLWLAVDISYVIGENHLLVKGGIMRSRILYKDITKITGNPSIWVGYRLLFSRDAIEIHYKTGMMGSVIISPERKSHFIRELVQKNPDIRVEIEGWA